jgi:Leucine-rich repeat (LRR) protein
MEPPRTFEIFLEQVDTALLHLTSSQNFSESSIQSRIEKIVNDVSFFSNEYISTNDILPLNALADRLHLMGFNLLASKVESAKKILLDEENRLNSLLELWINEGNVLEKRAEAKDKIMKFFFNKDEEALVLMNLNLTTLPPIFNIPSFVAKLKSLYLFFNELTTLPAEIRELRNLEHLVVTKNVLTIISPEIGHLVRLKGLALPNNKLTTVPPEICQLSNLEGLDLRHNELSILPAEIHLLSSLKELELGRNHLAVFPLPICQIKSLEKLDLSNNRLTTVPPEIGQLNSLKELKLRNNNFSTVLPEICQIRSLEKLDLCNNGLITIPSEINQLINLVELNLKNNRIRTIPPEIGQLDKLICLNLQTTRLTGIPSEILHLSKECMICLDGTPLSQAILENFRTIMAAPGYAGPRISYSMVNANPRGIEPKSIEDSLKGLYEIAQRFYVPFLPGNGIDENELKSWLSRLSYMADYKASPERRQWLVAKVLDYLALADKDPKFRESFGITIVGAAETCGDRVALSIIKIGIDYRLTTIDISNLKELADFLIRGVWATNLLEGIAREKIPTLPFFDEIEVYLGYPVKLKERLQLPIDVDEMLYFTCSALTEEDLEQAALSVIAKLESEVARFDFLVTEKKWQKALSEKYPFEYQSLIDERAMSEEKVPTKNYTHLQESFKVGLIDLTKRALKF